MNRWLRLALASLPLLLLAVPATAGADSKFADIDFADQARVVTLTLPAVQCRVDRTHVYSCLWQLFVNEPDVPGQPVVAAVSGTSGVLSVPYPSGFCGVLQADALFGTPFKKVVGYRHLINTCDCPSPMSPNWPSVVSGSSPVDAHDAQGFYLSELDNTWTLSATHPHSSGQLFSGTITTNGTFTHVQSLKLEGHDRVTQVSPNQITFRFVNRGYLDGVSFQPVCGNQLTFNTDINGVPSSPNHIFLGPTLTAASSSPTSFSG